MALTPLTAFPHAALAQTALPASVAPDLYARIQVAGFSKPIDLHRSGNYARLDVHETAVPQIYITDRAKGILISLISGGPNPVALVFPFDRAESIVPLPLDLAVLARQAQLKVVGASLVNGRSCRLIQFSAYLGQAGMVCVGADNIILQMTREGHREPLFEVVDLVMGEQDAKWFRVPPNYKLAVMPAIGGASADNDGTQAPADGSAAAPTRPILRGVQP
ncbi:hypothetical protein [Asticcacaulis sp. EMRT-3]|uniref:hypothetical protein n=1 Tax=Asticcacaulis sp. EMRT-3 TaxID=3040349 RepID=UPI0024AEA081|nr:hypothetical protein [Asticcacaulis sp. EMRT-3]MDI7774489.1 hypothetical protein [Asticcacaulis sp. EMRT-3]